MQRVADSNGYLACITPLLPRALVSAVRAGPLTDDTWCLLVTHSAALAKLRQLQPLLLSRLQHHGHAVKLIEMKVLKP